MDVPAQIPWSSLVHLLSNDKKWAIKTLDTVFANPASNDLQWYFTNKTGSISKKKRDGASNDNIIDRFSRFALSNPFNAEEFVCSKIDSSGRRENLKREQLVEYLGSNREDLKQNGNFLQVYLRPLQGEPIVLLCESTVGEGDQYAHTIAPNSLGLEGNADIQAQVDAINSAIIDCLRVKHGQRVQRMAVECVVDDNEHVWLSRVPLCVATIDSALSQSQLQSQSQSLSPIPSPAKQPAALAGASEESKGGVDAREDGEPAGTKGNARSPAKATSKSTSKSRTQAPQSSPQVEQLLHSEMGAGLPADSPSSSSPAAPSDTAGGMGMGGMGGVGPGGDSGDSSVPDRFQYRTSQALAPDADPQPAYAMQMGGEHADGDSGDKAVSKRDLIEKSRKKKGTGKPVKAPAQSSGFRRSKMDEPPSIELMAKFAAEKERAMAAAPDVVKEHKEGRKGKKEGAKAIRRSHSSGAQQLSPLAKRQQMQGDAYGYEENPPFRQVNALDMAERRLEELNKLAATTAQMKSLSQQQMGGIGGLGLANARQPLGSGGSARDNGGASAQGQTQGYRPSMSGSEAEFLSRQISSADVHQLSLFNSMEDAGGMGMGMGGMDGGSLMLGGDSVWSAEGLPLGMGGSMASAGAPLAGGVGVGPMASVMNEAMHERIMGLERQISTLQGSLDRKESELGSKDIKIRRLQGEVDNAKKAGQVALAQLTADYDLRVLRLSEHHDKEKSALVMGNPAAMAAAAEQVDRERSKGRVQFSGQEASEASAPASSHEANSKLIEQVEGLRAEQRRLHDAFAQDRKSLLAEANNKLTSQERSLRAEIMELRSTQAGLEDGLTNAAEELTHARSRIGALQAVGQQQEAAKVAALDMQNRLRADLKNMQQSVQASYRLEASQGIGAGGTSVDPETAIRLSEAKNEAKTRQLMNKLEFLKAQLDTEKKSADDARQTSQTMQHKLDETREDHRMRMLQGEDDLKHAVELAEQRIDEQYQDRMVELTTLQMRVNSIQGMLGEAQENEMLSRQREDASKGVASRASSHQAALKVELEQLREQVRVMREEREHDLLKETGKQSQESVIRRLDNERQYLKSQLGSEITHKNELQTALTQCQQQLSEVQKQWGADVDSLKDSSSSAQQSSADREQQLKATQTQLDSELYRTQQQNKDLKEGFVKIRDQVRMEQLALENAHTAHRRLQEAYEEAEETVVRLRQQEEQTAEMHKMQMDAINETVAQQEARNAAVTSQLREELSNQFMTNSRTQSQMIQLKDTYAEEKSFLGRVAGMVRIVTVLQRWRSNRTANGFRQWHTNSSLVGAARQFREQVDGILKKTAKELHRDKVQALDKLRTDLNAKHADLMASKEGDWEQALGRALDEAEADKALALEHASAEHASVLAQAEADFAFDLETARNEGEEAESKAIARKDAQIQKLNEFFSEQTQLAEKEAQERLEDALVVKEQEMDEVRVQELGRQRDDMFAKQRALLLEAANDRDVKLTQAAADAAQKLRNTVEALEAQHAAADEAAEAAHQQKCEDLRLQRERELADLRRALLAQSEGEKSELKADMMEAEETRLRELREAWQTEFDNRAASLQGEYEVQLGEKMEQYAKAVEAEKMRSVKIEASKWKQALKDSAQNHVLESVKTKAEVANEKDQEMQMELDKLAKRYESQRQEEQGVHRNEVLEMHKDRAVALERAANQHATAMKKQKAQLEDDLKALHDQQWGERMKAELGECEVKWRARLRKEQDRVDSLKEDFAIQAENFADERANLVKQVNVADERIEQIEAMSKAEVQEIRRKHYEDQLEWEANQAEALVQAGASGDKRLAKAVDEMKRQCRADYDKLLAGEAGRMHGELDAQVGAMQEESEKLISGLEQAMGNLKNEKIRLSQELEGLANRLEETEDSLYDTQQELKKTKLEGSMGTWRSVAKIFSIRQRFQEGMEAFDKEASARYAQIKQDMQAQLDSAVLVSLKLCALLQRTDAARLDTHTVLTSHRTGELVQNRNKIQVMEQSLERLTMEKDSLEEQKELLEGDVSQMESQVRQLEDQIRVHNQESSMSNGRINVAHARKKRRLDTELEHQLESIEQKRHDMTQMDRRVTEKGHERDDLEMEMIDIERKLVEILLEQQKMVLARVDEGKMVIDQTKVVMGVAKMSFPVPAEPSLKHVEDQKAHRKMLDNKGKIPKDSDQHPEYAQEDGERASGLYMKKF